MNQNKCIHTSKKQDLETWQGHSQDEIRIGRATDRMTPAGEIIYTLFHHCPILSAGRRRRHHVYHLWTLTLAGPPQAIRLPFDSPNGILIL